LNQVLKGDCLVTEGNWKEPGLQNFLLLQERSFTSLIAANLPSHPAAFEVTAGITYVLSALRP
jgi:hypothetical protein